MWYSQPKVPSTGVANGKYTEENDDHLDNNLVDLKCANDQNYKFKLIWHLVILMVFQYLGAIYGVYSMFTSARILTSIYALILAYAGGFGVTAGAHRLWTHRAYKAKLPLRILLLILHTMAHGMSVLHWARDHRVHHKHCETDADPYNAKRGFFFCHIGWLLCERHPENIVKGEEMDVSDLENDPLLRFQYKHYNILMPIACFILPPLIPVYLWDETIVNAVCIADALRWIVFLNVTSSVNSFAHIYGSHRYNKFSTAADNKMVAFAALGEGWHNYHHAFPWDYKTSELGLYSFNFTTFFIDCMAKIGWAYDLKTVSSEMIKRRVQRTGDGTHRKFGGGDKDGTNLGKNNFLNTHQKYN